MKTIKSITSILIFLTSALASAEEPPYLKCRGYSKEGERLSIKVYGEPGEKMVLYSRIGKAPTRFEPVMVGRNGIKGILPGMVDLRIFETEAGGFYRGAYRSWDSGILFLFDNVVCLDPRRGFDAAPVDAVDDEDFRWLDRQLTE